MRFEKDGKLATDVKDSREHITPGLSRRSQKPARDLNDNHIEASDKKATGKKMEAKTEDKGAEAVVDLKAEAAKRRQSE